MGQTATVLAVNSVLVWSYMDWYIVSVVVSIPLVDWPNLEKESKLLGQVSHYVIKVHMFTVCFFHVSQSFKILFV